MTPEQAARLCLVGVAVRGLNTPAPQFVFIEDPNDDLDEVKRRYNRLMLYERIQRWRQIHPSRMYDYSDWEPAFPKDIITIISEIDLKSGGCDG